MKEWKNERMKEGKKERRKEGKNERMKEWKDERMKERERYIYRYIRGEMISRYVIFEKNKQI